VRRHGCDIHGPLRHGRRIHAPLHRRIFGIFTLTIAATAAIGLLLMRAAGGGAAWRVEVERARTFMAHRFAEAWDDPAARERVTRGFAQDLDIDLVVRDSRGSIVSSAGEPCSHPLAPIAIERDGQPLGTATVCLTRHHMGGGWSAVAPLFIALGLLWLASGFIARRLLRPLHRLAEAAGQVGRGDVQARAQLRQAERGEVAVLGQVLDDMTGRIEQQLADQRALMAAVSHEIRTPLSRIRLLTEMARDAGSDPKTLDAIDREVVEIDELVSDLLAGSRLDFSELKRRPLLAPEVAREAAERAGVDPAALVVEAPNARVEADPTLLARALANLLDNAKQHGGGVSALRVLEREGLVVFEVDDGGPGFEPGDEERAFEPFYRRPRQGQAESRSIGLGLALVRRIAQAHGGRAHAANRAEGGARVSIELPG
jgi:signal transduction histidine kinase